MGFWSFLRDMLVFDWLFGHRKRESSGEYRPRESHRHTDQTPDDYSRRYGNYCDNYHTMEDIEDDIDSGMFDDDLDSGLFDDDMDSGMFDDDFDSRLFDDNIDSGMFHDDF